jgi:hypothetical protein
MGFYIRADEGVCQPSSGMAAAGTRGGPLMGSVSPVSDQSQQRGIPPDFPANRGGTSAKLFGDTADGRASFQADSDFLPFFS